MSPVYEVRIQSLISETVLIKFFPFISKVLTHTIRRGDFHGVGWDMHGVGISVPAGTGLGDPLLVTRKLYELPQVFLAQPTQGVPEKLDVLVRVHQSDLIHGVGLLNNVKVIFQNLNLYSNDRLSYI